MYWGEPVEKERYIVYRCLENIRYYAHLSGFDLRVIDKNGYLQYLSGDASR